MTTKGKLFLIPCPLGDLAPLDSLSPQIKTAIEQQQHFIVENEKEARRFIKRISPEKKQNELQLYPLNKYTTELEYRRYLDVCESGTSIGLISDAGCPGIADPGGVIVALAHQKNIQVVPLVGHLPIAAKERTQAIKKLERAALQNQQTQLFIETPYRNISLLESLIQQLQPSTLLTLACDLSLPTEWIKTYSIQHWKKLKLDSYHKRPAVFLVHGPD
jgi:16S rRNA (cytidine1402-2'-O)-methyltransferase